VSIGDPRFEGWEIVSTFETRPRRWRGATSSVAWASTRNASPIARSTPSAPPDSRC
jgi:hypothetical protein